MTSSITCHAPITNLEGWKHLASGVDTLDVGVYVQWSDAWEKQKAELEEAKTRAAGTEGVPLNDRQFLVLPSGKPPRYRWHLQWPDLHLFLGTGRSPHKDTPNVYAKLNSETLWRNGVEGAVALVVHEIEALGGTVLKVKPSRCDVASDFYIPGGIPQSLLMACRVPAGLSHDYRMKGDRLETFYQGGKKSPIQLRIYDKGEEILKGGTKLWFREVWKVESCESVWRVEFQIRRPCLKHFSVNSIPELLQALPGLWKFLTEEWFSLRLGDDLNVSRRSVHPWWLGVQCCDAKFGEPQPLVKSDTQSPVDASWFVSHGAGCLLGYAARQRIGSASKAAAAYIREILAYWERRSFADEYATKSIKLGFVDGSANQSESEMDLGEAA